MAFTVAPETGNKNIVIGSWTSYHTLGGFPLKGYAGLNTRIINVDLENTAYETGGIPIPKEITGLKRVVNMWTLSGWDPYHQVAANPPALSFRLDSSDPEAPKLVIHDGSGELANAATQPADTTVWLMLGGID